MSTLNVTNISDGTNSTSTTNVVKGSAKAWVNFNGTGTVAIREAYNVSSIADNGVGLFTVNFTTAFADTNYQVSTSGYIDPNNTRKLGVVGPYGSFNTPSGAYSTGSINIACAIGDSGTGNAEMHDTDTVNVAIHK